MQLPGCQDWAGAGLSGLLTPDPGGLTQVSGLSADSSEFKLVQQSSGCIKKQNNIDTH